MSGKKGSGCGCVGIVSLYNTTKYIMQCNNVFGVCVSYGVHVFVAGCLRCLVFVYLVLWCVSVRTVGDVMSPSQEQMGVAPLSLPVSADSDP